MEIIPNCHTLINTISILNCIIVISKDYVYVSFLQNELGISCLHKSLLKNNIKLVLKLIKIVIQKNTISIFPGSVDPTLLSGNLRLKKYAHVNFPCNDLKSQTEKL